MLHYGFNSYRYFTILFTFQFYSYLLLAPETPIIVGHVEAGSSSTLVIDWEITSNSGDPGDTTCTVQYSLSSNRIWIDVSDDILQDATRYLLTGLPTYTKYDVRISCDNQYGTSNRLELTTWTGVSCELHASMCIICPLYIIMFLPMYQ